MAVAVAVLVLNPVFGVFSEPGFGAEELRAAVEGTWRLTVRGADGSEQAVMFRLAQGSEVEGGQSSARALVRPAAACGTRTLVRTAGACGDVTRMPLEVRLIAQGVARRQAEPGEFVVLGTEFRDGQLRVTVGDVRLSAGVTARGEVVGVSSHGTAGRELASTLARIAR